MANTYTAGIVTAYGAAVRGGYTGTYDEFCAQQAGYAESAAAVAAAEIAAAASAAAAASSESNAASSETHAAASETAAAASETAAAGSATLAASSETNAATSETNAAASATTASAAAATAQEVLASIPHDYSTLSATVDAQGIRALLTMEEIPDTVQTVTFDSDGNPASVTHTDNGTAVRTDVFTFGTDTITEVRTLSSGQSLTIVTNTTTLVTTVTYSAA